MTFDNMIRLMEEDNAEHIKIAVALREKDPVISYGAYLTSEAIMYALKILKKEGEKHG